VKNSSGQPAVFIDTFEGSNVIYQNMGRNFSLQFAFDAMVLDAKKMGAKELILYKCPYGKPLEFVNFVRDIYESNNDSIKDLKAGEYLFSAIDEKECGLSDSLEGKRHYTDAFGHDAQIVEGRRSVIKDMRSSGRSYYVVDVEKYLMTNGFIAGKQ
jgi:hypothetical protein